MLILHVHVPIFRSIFDYIEFIIYWSVWLHTVYIIHHRNKLFGQRLHVQMYLIVNQEKYFESESSAIIIVLKKLDYSIIIDEQTLAILQSHVKEKALHILS